MSFTELNHPQSHSSVFVFIFFNQTVTIMSESYWALRTFTEERLPRHTNKTDFPPAAAMFVSIAAPTSAWVKIEIFLQQAQSRYKNHEVCLGYTSYKVHTIKKCHTTKTKVVIQEGNYSKASICSSNIRVGFDFTDYWPTSTPTNETQMEKSFSRWYFALQLKGLINSTATIPATWVGSLSLCIIAKLAFIILTSQTLAIYK